MLYPLQTVCGLSESQPCRRIWPRIIPGSCHLHNCQWPVRYHPSASRGWNGYRRSASDAESYIRSLCINRPGISYLNPAVVTSPTIVQQGNPQLSSSHTQRISLIYSYILPKLTLQIAPAYNFSSGGISSIQTAKDDVRYYTYDNILRYRRFSIEQYVQWKPFDSTTLVINNNLRYEYNENPNLGYRTDGQTTITSTFRNNCSRS